MIQRVTQRPNEERNAGGTGPREGKKKKKLLECSRNNEDRLAEAGECWMRLIVALEEERQGSGRIIGHRRFE